MEMDYVMYEAINVIKLISKNNKRIPLTYGYTWNELTIDFVHKMKFVYKIRYL